MSQNKLILASEATKELDFGDGTKIRVGNQVVTLKGKFYRDDHFEITQANETMQSLRDAHGVLDVASVEKYPYDRDRALAMRIQTLAKERDFQKSEKNKLLDMVATRDETIRKMGTAIEQHKAKLLRVIYDCGWGIINGVFGEKS